MLFILQLQLQIINYLDKVFRCERRVCNQYDARPAVDTTQEANKVWSIVELVCLIVEDAVLPATDVCPEGGSHVKLDRVGAIDGKERLLTSRE